MKTRGQGRLGNREVCVVGCDDGDELHARVCGQRRLGLHHRLVIRVNTLLRQVQSCAGLAGPLRITTESAANQVNLSIHGSGNTVYSADKGALTTTYHSHPHLGHILRRAI